jgi:hypothetical protein
MLKKLTAKEEEDLVRELTTGDWNLDDLLGPSKKRSKSVKTPIEKLKSYHLIVEASVFWASRQDYLKVIQSFLLKKIDGEILTSEFFKVRSEDLIKSEEFYFMIEDQILPIPDLSYTSQASNFNEIIGDLYLEIEKYDPTIEDTNFDDPIFDIVYSENELRSLIEKKFVPILQKSCDLSDSFFQPHLDLDKLIRRSYIIFITSSLGLFTSLIASIFIKYLEFK